MRPGDTHLFSKVEKKKKRKENDNWDKFISLALQIQYSNPNQLDATAVDPKTGAAWEREACPIENKGVRSAANAQALVEDENGGQHHATRQRERSTRNPGTQIRNRWCPNERSN